MASRRMRRLAVPSGPAVPLPPTDYTEYLAATAVHHALCTAALHAFGMHYIATGHAPDATVLAHDDPALAGLRERALCIERIAREGVTADEQP